MIAIKGYFDGMHIQPLEDFAIKQNQKVIITVMDEFIEPEKKINAESLRGALSKYANPALRELEEGAWERAAAEKYVNARY